MIESVVDYLATSDWLDFASTAASLVAGIFSGSDVLRRLITFRLNNFEQEVFRRAQICRTKTDYVGALLARYTAIITANLLVMNISLNLATAVRIPGSEFSQMPAVSLGMYVVAAVCAFSVIVTITVVLAICSEIIRQVERDV